MLTISPSAPDTLPAIVMNAQPVVAGHHYLVEWMMSVEGEKRWRYQAEFSGVIVSFKDAAGATLSTVSRHTSCWSTEGWQPAWYRIEAPSGASSLTVSFAIYTRMPLPGRFRIMDFRIHDESVPMLAPPKHGILQISVRDDQGTPTESRVYVRDSSGKSFVPPNVFSCNQGGVCFYNSPLLQNQYAIPAGSYRISAMKGFEYAVAQEEVQVSDGETTRVNLTLTRQFNLAKLGWWAGDHHTHLFRHGGSHFPMMNLGDVYAIAKGEGLEFLPFMGLDKGEQGSEDVALPGFLGRATEELTRDFWGHICPIGVKGNPALIDQGDSWPMNCDFIADALLHHGAIAYAHPYGPLRKETILDSLADPKAGLIARGFPIDVALGQPCTLDVLAKEDANGDFALKLRDYMGLLNLGFKVGVSGSTDFHLDQGREPIGGLRTYVHTAELNWPNVADAYNHGRTFASNGPLALFTVNSEGPGATIELGFGSSVECRVDAYSLWGIRLVQIWQDGVKVKEISASDGKVQAAFSLPVKRSGWLLATVEGDAAPEVMHSPEGKPMVSGQYAITSPVYVNASLPALPAPESAQYFVDWVNAVERGFHTLCEQAEAAKSAVPKSIQENVERRLDRARKVFAARVSPATQTSR